MRNIIIILFLFNCFLINAQQIKFINEEKNPIENVEMGFTINNEQKKFVSNSNGIINLKKYFLLRTNVNISHLSYQPYNKRITLKDTTFVLKKKNFITDEIFVTGQIKPTYTSEAIQKVKLITRKEIDLIAANNLQELLAKEVNIMSSYDNILGSSISMQGVSGQNIKVLVDGVPIIGRLNGNLDLSQINLNNITRVEIIEGPLSVDFGTDALAGTINLITTKNNKNNKQFSSTYNVFYESVGNYNSNISLSYNIKKHKFSLDLARKYFDGWSENEKFSLLPSSQIADTNRVDTWKPKLQYLGKAQYQIKNKTNNLRCYYDYYFEKITNLGFPRLPYYETAFDDYYYTKRMNAGIDYMYNFENENLHLLSSFNHYKRIKNTYFKDLVTLNQLLTNNNGDQDTSMFNLLMNKLIFSSFKKDNFNYQIGIDSKKEDAQGQRINNNCRSLIDHAIFISSKWKPYSFFAVKPAVRISYNSKFNVPIIPSLNLLLSKNKFKTRFSYAKGFRSPSLKELFFEFVDINHNIVGNSNLDAETSENCQINFDYEENLSHYKIELSTKLFYNDIKNLITIAKSPDSETYTYFNLGVYKTKGISTNLYVSSTNFNFSFAASNIGRYNNLSAENDIMKFSHSMAYNTSCNYTLPKYYITTSIYYNYTGKLPIFYQNSDNQIIQAEVESYQIFDLILKKAFAVGKINISLGVKNLFDIQNITSFSSSNAHSSSSNKQSIAYGRTFFSSLRINL